MIKFLGVIFIIICGAGIGAKASGDLKKRSDMCLCVKTFLSELSILMKYSGDTLFNLISELAERESISKLTFLSDVINSMLDGTNFPYSWKNALSNDKNLCPELKELLFTLGESLGTSDIDGQLVSIERAEKELLAIYENALSIYRKKGKLYRSIGILGGMTAALLLC